MGDAATATATATATAEATDIDTASVSSDTKIHDDINDNNNSNPNMNGNGDGYGNMNRDTNRNEIGSGNENSRGHVKGNDSNGDGCGSKNGHSKNGGNKEKRSKKTKTTTKIHKSKIRDKDREGRCHYYNEAKKRFCRQLISRRVPQHILDQISNEKNFNLHRQNLQNFRPIYCGNHASMYDTDQDTVLLWNRNDHDDDNHADDSAERSNIGMDTDKDDDDQDGNFKSNERKKRKLDESAASHPQVKVKVEKEMRRRIPCPIDPSHTIYECNLKAHLLKCPKARMEREDRQRPFYQHNINVGGHGCMNTMMMCIPVPVTDTDKDTDTETETKQSRKRSIHPQSLALQILRAYLSIFTPISSSSSSSSPNHSSAPTPMSTPIAIPSRDILTQLTFQDLYERIPMENHRHHNTTTCATPGERSLGFVQSTITEHRVKIGGMKHLEQIESIVGHIRNANAKAGHAADMSASCSNSVSADVSEGTSVRVGERVGVNADASADTPNAGVGNVPLSLLHRSKTILEMGAGRATTGFVVASVCANARNKEGMKTNNSGNGNGNTNVKLVLVERCGSRAKADGAFRRKGGDRSKNQEHKQQQQQQPSHDGQNSTNAIEEDDANQVDVHRIKCDLAHVHIPHALEDAGVNVTEEKATSFTEDTVAAVEAAAATKDKCRDILVIAKHLCGAGTDLALKSIHPIRHRLTGCVMATCCHSLCDWSMYVGRDTLSNVMDSVSDVNEEGGQALRAVAFGEEAFNIMKRWACGTVLFNSGSSSENETRVDPPGVVEEDDEEEHNTNISEGPKDAPANSSGNILDDDYNISKLCKLMGLKCGPQGLGRACQRLIDYGRCEYMRTQLFPDTNSIDDSGDGVGVGVGEGGTARKDRTEVKLCHYVDRNVTPQNALLFAYTS